MNQPRVSVVICTLGRSEHLLATARAALSQDGPVHEVIVVDNDPTAGSTRSALAVIDDPRLRIVDEPRRGASRARNTGAGVASGDILAFTDDDATPDPQWTTALAATLDAHPAVTCVTSRVLPASLESSAQQLFEHYGGFGKGERVSHWHPGSGEDSLNEALDKASASLGSMAEPATRGYRGVVFPLTAGEFGSGVVAFRARDFAELGGFDPALGPGTIAKAGEDLDLCRRAYLSGGTVVYQPAALVRHHHRESIAELREQVHGYGVGLTAALTKLLLTRPGLIARFLVRLPAALRMLLAADSTKNESLPEDFPTELLWDERRGILLGPVRFAQSAWRVRRQGLSR